MDYLNWFSASLETGHKNTILAVDSMITNS